MSVWTRGGGVRLPPRPLAARTFGAEGPLVVLLHGLAGSGEEYGARWDALGDRARVVVPDLLGFGRSHAVPIEDYGVPDQLDSLDALLAGLETDAAPLIVGHSMGAVLGLAWAARRGPTGARGVVAMAAPLYTDAAEADRTLADSDPVNKLMTAPGAWPARLCGALCGGPWWGKALYVAANPWYPPALAVEGVWHTFASYRRSLDLVLRTPVWRPALQRCLDEGVPVLLAGGATDRIVVSGRDVALAAQHPELRLERHPSAGHDLPISEPDWCVQLVESLL